MQFWKDFAPNDKGQNDRIVSNGKNKITSNYGYCCSFHLKLDGLFANLLTEARHKSLHIRSYVCLLSVNKMFFEADIHVLVCISTSLLSVAK